MVLPFCEKLKREPAACKSEVKVKREPVAEPLPIQDAPAQDNCGNQAV